ncbi:MAG: hypothetical protein HY000_20350 [Planctomycetes bacterium]|nr:hypothetical protein [Planctomycetota bacterium]
MANSTTTVTGIVHGDIIKLDELTGLPDGQHVAVTVRPVSDSQKPSIAGEGLRRAFGAWADDGEELDEYLEWNRRQRSIGRPELEP